MWYAYSKVTTLYAADTLQAEIWGTPHQVAEARTQLEIFEKAIRVEHTERKKDVGKWEKISALDGREKHRSERKAQADSFMEQQRQLGEMGEFDYEVNTCIDVKRALMTDSIKVLAFMAVTAFRLRPTEPYQH